MKKILIIMGLIFSVILVRKYVHIDSSLINEITGKRAEIKEFVVDKFNTTKITNKISNNVVETSDITSKIDNTLIVAPTNITHIDSKQSPEAETLDKISEIEKSTRYDKAGTINIYNTIEDHLYNFEKMYGTDELQKVLNSIENNTIEIYHSSLTGNKALYVADMYRVIKNYKICFIHNEKIYVLTYEPVQCKKNGNKEMEIITKKFLYLFRRDNDGWEEVSDLIDTHVINDEYLKEITPCINGYKPSIKILNEIVTIDYYITIWSPKLKNNCHYHKEKSVLRLKL